MEALKINKTKYIWLSVTISHLILVKKRNYEVEPELNQDEKALIAKYYPDLF